MNRSSLAKFGALVLLFSAGPLLADDADLPVPADEFVYCTVCHGVQLMGNPIHAAPRLSGMESWYIEQQLRAFRNGWRGSHSADAAGNDMRPMASGLSDAQITAVAAFVAATRSAPPPATLAGDAARGQSLYQTCSACHGAQAEGNEALGAPSLTGLNDWYQVAQLDNFKDGRRGVDPADIRGQQMAAAAASLGDAQAIRDVVSYISELPTN